jgi:benzoyl-CoA reductase/2-hydroxyglutaryl-CoA dehydratase subunit BcrC/BadD/HgdB
MKRLDDFAKLRHGGRERARAAKAAGRKVVAYMGATVPLELFDAADVFATPLHGDAEAPTPLADRYMESLFDPRVREALQAVLAGAWDMVDLIVLPRTSDSQQRFYYYLCELRRMGVPVPEAKLYDLLHTPWSTSADYNLARTAELTQSLEALTGRPISEGDLSRAIGAGNMRRGGLRELVALRRANPARIGGVEALDAFAASRVMPPTEFASAMRDVVSEAKDQQGPRVVVAGSAQDTTRLAALIAELCGVVVGDFHAEGEAMIGAPIGESGPPLPAICAHYHHEILSSRTFPTDIGAVTRFAREAGAQGVVFHYDAEEEALTWDLPAQKRDLQAAGFQTIVFADQPRRFDKARLAQPLGAFLRALAPAAREPGRG